MNDVYPLLLSFLIGHLLLDWIPGKREIHPFLKLFFGCGLGLGISSEIVFYSFVLVGRLHSGFVLTIHFLLLAALLVRNLITFKNARAEMRLKTHITRQDLLFLLILIAAAFPLWAAAQLYPYGGWDAWAVWNFKARVLFLDGDGWKNIFNPALWRSSPHYPFLLPLINVWGWMLRGVTTYTIPLLTAVAFTLSTAGILLYGFQGRLKHIRGGFAVVLVLTSPFFLVLAVSQYADIVLGYYLLATLWCLITARRENNEKVAFLGGIFLGLLSFTKTEGMVAALIILALSFPHLCPKGTESKSMPRTLSLFLTAAVFSALPAFLFYIFYAPGNQTFINGLFSRTQPATLSRLVVTAAAFPLELISGKWNGLWIVLLAGLLIGWKNSLRPEIRIIPLFIVYYCAAVGGYYWVNTRFEVVWFITSSFNRIVFALLPTVLFWTFSSNQSGDAQSGDV